jgi:collagen type IV alpha-3-binding protein
MRKVYDGFFFQQEVDKRKKYEEAYKSMATEKREKLHIVGGPDYEEGPHCMITEDEFYDAVDATLDKLEKEEEKVSANENCV